MIRAVVDSSVLASAFIGNPDARPGRLVTARREHHFVLIACPELLAELGDVLARPKFARWSTDGRADVDRRMTQATATQKPGGRRCCLALGIVNQTVHAIKHIGWVPDQTGGYRGQMAVYVKPNGLLGTGYMAAIRPFRHLILYPPMTRQIGRDWRARMPENLPAAPYKVVRRAATDRAAERSPNRAGGGSSGQPAMSSPGPFANPFGR